ncbi:MAG: hypothetical protein DRJ63_06475 [Thermoprotei archaeon]|nr:MAG: hypothetical protein DRJ63_06475 [Thermoprotei archaeon]
MPYMLGGYRVLWAVRTGNETDRPIEELRVIVEKNRLDVRGLSFRGKRDMCLLAREMLTGPVSHEDASVLCRTYRKNCKYYRTLIRKEQAVLDMFSGPMMYTEVLEKCSRLGVCPYFAQYILLEEADIVSLSYNYIFMEGISWSVKRIVPFSDSILVVDEAHNLQHLNLYSDKITLNTISNAAREAAERGLAKIVDVLKKMYSKVAEYRKILKDEEDMLFDPEDFRELLSRSLLERMRAHGQRIREQQIRQKKRPHSSLYHLANFWLSVFETQGTDGFAYIASRDRDNIILELWDMRSREILSNVWKQFYRVVLMSGTLAPIDAFAETVGIEKYSGKIIASDYDPRRVLPIILKGVTTRGEELPEEMCLRYISLISALVGKLRVNTAVFTASYRIQRELIKHGLLEELRALGAVVFVERKDMKGDEARDVLTKFKELSLSRDYGVLVGPASGRFAEGADFPGRELEAVFLVGIPFDRVTARTKKYIEYYTQIYGRDKGRYYAYIVPALRRASQALGRALRSSEDRAVLVAGDQRYLRYLDLLPDYFTNSVKVVKYTDFGSTLEKFSLIK